MSFLDELKARGLIEQLSDPAIGEILAKPPVTAYAGFDPTASSLHVGNLMPLTGLMRLQRAGHRPIALVGGATGLVGDPSGKAEERKLLSRDEIASNIAGVRAQLERFLDFGPGGAELVNNAQWFDEIRYLDFLRDVGKHFPITMMLGKESVSQRIDREQGLSYTEFSYMLVQAYDFLWLHEHRGCTFQIGGSDQWGNITAGIELIRRKLAKPAWGYVTPLLTTAEGKKFGKTEQGNVWLDAARTSPYQMFQFFLNADDRDVSKLLKFLTFLPVAAIDELLAESARAPEKREAQRVLARELVTMVHGKDEADRAEQAAGALFGGGPVDLQAIAQGAPSTEITRMALEQGVPLTRLLVDTGLSASVSAARRDIEGGGIYVNEERTQAIDRTVGIADLKDGNVVLLRKGKKNYHLIRVQ
jgi:tyrosyl-tRNA synthetase